MAALDRFLWIDQLEEDWAIIWKRGCLIRGFPSRQAAVEYATEFWLTAIEHMLGQIDAVDEVMGDGV